MKHSLILMLVVTMFVVTTTAAEKKKQMETAVFHVEIHCDACVKKIQDNIAFEKGLKDMTIDKRTETVTLTWDPQETDTTTLKTAFEKIRKPVSRIDIPLQEKK